MEDLVSTTRYVTWSLHNKNRAGLRQFLDSFAGSEQSTSFNSTHASLSQELSSGSVLNDNRSDKPKSDVKLSHVASSNDASTSETRLVDLLDSTLWNRRLAPSSERIVYALVQQIFHGIRESFLASAELKFNCFLLMPVVDKLPLLLREELDKAFENELDNVFDITHLRYSLGQQKRESEVELKQIQRLKEKFKKIHEQLSSTKSVYKEAYKIQSLILQIVGFFLARNQVFHSSAAQIVTTIWRSFQRSMELGLSWEIVVDRSHDANVQSENIYWLPDRYNDLEDRSNDVGTALFVGDRGRSFPRSVWAVLDLVDRCNDREIVPTIWFRSVSCF